MTTTPTFPPVVFSVTDAAISELEAKHRGLVVAHGDKKGYLALTQAIAEIRTARTDVEKRRKELKQGALDYGRLVDSTLAADLEAAKPERERIITHVRACIDGLPETKTMIGGHMAQDVRDALGGLLRGWTVKEAA